MGCRASGIAGTDLDRKHADGIAPFARLCERNGPWPDTLTVRTAHGGLHLYFRVPPGLIIGSTSGGSARLGPGIDTRGPGRRSGGYLIGPRSVVDGTPYVIELDARSGIFPAGWVRYPCPAAPVRTGPFRPAGPFRLIRITRQLLCGW